MESRRDPQADSVLADSPSPSPVSEPSVPVDGRPVLLLDVDGVVNAMPRRGTSVGYTRHLIGGFIIHFEDDLVDMIRVLRKHFDIVWFTTWNQDAARSIGPHVGLDAADHFETSSNEGRVVLQGLGFSDGQISQIYVDKTPLIARYLGTKSRWVWIDDQHTKLDAEFLTDQGFDPRRFELISADPEVGLSWEIVGQAIRFANMSGNPTCPECGGDSVPLVHGFPSGALMGAYERGEVALGGCCLPAGPIPEWACPQCDREFNL